MSIQEAVRISGSAEMSRIPTTIVSTVKSEAISGMPAEAEKTEAMDSCSKQNIRILLNEELKAGTQQMPTD